MSKATLTYVLNKANEEDNSVLYLESGSLNYVDHCTKRYQDAHELRNSPLYKTKLDEFKHRSGQEEEGEFYVSYIEDSDRKEIIPILFNDDKDIITMLDIQDNATNEIEKARHLLWTSKDKEFLKTFLEEERFTDTTFFNIKLNGRKEIKTAMTNGFEPRLINGEYFLTIEEILQFKLDNDNHKFMRALIEDALEVWKEKLFELDSDSLYYYARALRILTNEYEEFLSQKKAVVDLDIDTINLYNVVAEGTTLIEAPVSGRHTYRSKNRQKVLLGERKAA